MTMWKEDGNGIIRAGQVGGDIQVGESYTRRFVHTRLPGRVVDVTVYPIKGDGTDAMPPEDAPIMIEWQTQTTVCRNVEDPGSTEVWSEIEHSDLPERYDGATYGSVDAAEEDCRRLMKSFDPQHIGWDGKPDMSLTPEFRHQLRHVHYSPNMPPRYVDGPLIDCTPQFSSDHEVELSETAADYMYTPRFGPHSASGLPDMDLVRLMTAYMDHRAEDTEFRIMNVKRDDEYTYRVTITNRTAHAPGDGPLWHTEVWGIHSHDGQWHQIPVNPHPGIEHIRPFCSNCGR